MLLAAAGMPESAPRPGPKLRPLSAEATAFGDARDRIFEAANERKQKIRLALQSLQYLWQRSLYFNLV